MRQKARRTSARAWVASGADVSVKAHARRYGVDRYIGYTPGGAPYGWFEEPDEP